MLATSETMMNQRPSRAQQREHDIELLKALRQKVLGIRVMADQFSHDLSYAFVDPLAKLDNSLKALLLERELDEGVEA